MSALAAYFALRRYAPYAPAAFAGGLCFGFGPFVASDLHFGHLHLTFLAVLPLIFLALDELFVRRTWPALRTGLLLGLLVIVQFFVSTELLALSVIVAFIGLVVLALANRSEVKVAARHAAPGLLAGIVLSTAVLAYPTWFAVAGPRHTTGPVFPNIDRLSATLAAAVLPHGERAGVGFISGGNGNYLGVPLVLLVVLAPLVWRRVRVLRFALFMAAISYLCSLGPSLHVTKTDAHLPLPAWVLQHLPLLDSIFPTRFAPFVDLFAALSLAVVLARVHAGDFGALGTRPDEHAGTVPTASRRRLLDAFCAAIAALALVPLLVLPDWPYPVHAVAEPAVFKQRPLTALAASSIVREYPPVINNASGFPLLWQAAGGFTYDLYDGYALVPGAAGAATEQVPVDPLAIVFAAGVLGRLRLPPSFSTDVAVRRSLAREHVSAVVVLPGTKGSGAVATVLTSALGPATRRVDGASVWLLSPG